MTDVASLLDSILSQWPGDAKVAQQKIKEVADKFRTVKAKGIDPNTILKVHPTGKVKQNAVDNRYEIFLIYSKTGANTASLLRPFLEKDLMSDSYLELEAGATFDPKKLENDVANSLLVVFLLTDATLFEPAVIFAMEAVQKYEGKHCHPVLVHDASNCYFPGGEQQAESIKHLFAEKAISLLPDYITVAADEVILKLEEINAELMAPEEGEGIKPKTLKSSLHKHNLIFYDPDGNGYHCNNCAEEGSEGETGERYHCMLCQYDLCEECGDANKESIKTSCFLSHKRTTAQVIAGRLYEGLKDDYPVFLDSEAKFKIHDLEKIVEQTDLMIVILSGGYLESYWCLQELRAAIKFKKAVLVVRDINFKPPPKESLGKEFDDVKDFIYNSPTIVWVAEYNSPCLKVIKKKFLGPSQDSLGAFDEWWKENKTKVLADMKEDGYLDFSEMPYDDNTVEEWLESFAIREKELVPSIKALRLSGLEFEEDADILALIAFPNLEKLDLSGCVLSGSVKLIGRVAPKLKEIDVSFTFLSDLPFTGMVRKLPDLEDLNIGRCNVTKWSLQVLADKCPKLKLLKLGGTNISKKGIKKFKKALPQCKLDLTVPDDEEEEEEEEVEEKEEEAEEEAEEEEAEEEAEEDEE